MRVFGNRLAFTLIELVLIISIIGVLSAVATLKLLPSLETGRYEATKAEMQSLIYAITGNPKVYSKGARTDFGYVGDIGALPTSLDALVINPGFSTWNGPYIKSVAADDYKKDAWDVDYVYTDTLIRSTGSNIDRIFARSSGELLSNTVSGYLVDADSDMPGAVYRDSINIILIYPDGSGGMTSVSINPGGNGDFAFAGIPVGNHILRAIYHPDSDTIEYSITVMPASNARAEILFPSDLW